MKESQSTVVERRKAKESKIMKEKYVDNGENVKEQRKTVRDRKVISKL